jgi:hypothetical protein
MQPTIEAAGVLVASAAHPRRPKSTDHQFKVAFRVLPDEEALQRLDGLQLSLPLGEDPEDGAQYAASLSGSGLGVYGRLDALRGQPLHRGDFVKLELRAGRHRARIRCLGLVAWVRVNKDARVFRAGVGFVGVDPRDLAQAALPA